MKKALEPFIARYGEHNCSNVLPTAAVRYMPEKELLFDEKRNCIAIESKEASIDITGSTITRAVGDPTRDEPTDRL